MANQYSENLFVAMDTIIKARLKDLEYDKTVICTIVDNSDRLSGKYIVSDGTSQFEAFSDITSYKNDMQVYVIIPKGDYNNQKLISGRYVSEFENKAFAYVSPFDECLDITGNIIPGVVEKGLIANEVDENFIIKATEVSLFEEIPVLETQQHYSILGFSAEFRSWLADLKVRSGHYGIKIRIYPSDSKENFIEKKFDCTNMFGNIYNFDNYYRQEIVFDISDISYIHSLDVVFYQDGDFRNEENELVQTYLISGFDGMPISTANNLFVKDPYLFFGYGLNEFNENGTFLYTLDKTTYNDSNCADPRTLRLRWLVKTDDRVQEIKALGLDSKTRIHWYKKVIGEEVSDLLAGDFWKEIPEAYNRFNYTVKELNTNTTSEIFKVIITQSDNFNSDTTLEQEVLKVENKYESNEFSFTYDGIPKNLETLDLIKGLEILCEGDSYNGNYLIYGIDQYLINKAEAFRTNRKFVASYTEVKTGKEEFDAAAAEISWHFPKVGSMIHKPEASIEYSKDDEFTETATEYIITRKRKKIEGKDETELNLEQPYRIEEYFLSTRANNTIKCVIKKQSGGNMREYVAERTLYFGPSGSNGTDYSLVIEAVGSDSAILIPTKESSSTQIILRAKLFDSTNKEISLSDNKIGVSWDLYTGTIYLEKNDLIPQGENCIVKLEYLYNEEGNLNINAIGANVISAKIIWKVPTSVEGEFRPVELTALYPLPIKFSEEFKYIEGATTVVYDANGANPTYYKLPYKLFDKDNKEIKDIKWELYTPNIKKADDKQLTYLPKVIKKNATDTTAMGYYLEPLVMYVSDLDKNISVVARDEAGNLLWKQPLLIIQNRYQSSMLNAWDGSLTIDEENGTILSSMVGAGKKDKDNTFSGVLMGEVSKAGLGEVGLYGYQQSVSTFGFKVDGTAFIGRSGGARLEFDGTKGTIQSASYKESKTGMKLDFDDGIIDIRGAEKTSGENTINTNAEYSSTGARILIQTKSPYLEIKGDTYPGTTKTPTLMLVGKNNYYLQSYNYELAEKQDYPKLGTKFNLQNGNLMCASDAGYVSITPNQNDIFKVRTWKKDGTNGFNTLMCVGKNGYYLCSENFVDADPRQGMKIDLSNGQIRAYSGFTLTGKSEQDGNIRLSTFDPYFRIQAGTDKKTIMYVGKNRYYLESYNYEEDTSGVSINLDDGYAQFLNIDAQGGKIGGCNISDEGIYTSNWNINSDGSVNFYEGTIGGWTINSDSLSGGKITLNSEGSISGGSTYTWSIEKDGTATFNRLKASNSGTIGGWTIGSSTLSAGEKKDEKIILDSENKSITIGGATLTGWTTGVKFSGPIFISNPDDLVLGTESLSAYVSRRIYDAISSIPTVKEDLPGDGT